MTQHAPWRARTPLIAGNWKMYKTVSEAKAFIAALLPQVASADGVDVAICPPFVALPAMVASTRGSRVEVYAQNMHQAAEGAFTGEISAPMLAEVGVHGVILGHSERREQFAETDRVLQLKVPAAFEAGLLPILCVGETETEREQGDTERKLRHQVKEDLARLDESRLGELVIAYEPIWAIGTGQVATPEQAQEASAFVRAVVPTAHPRRRSAPGSCTAAAPSPRTPPSCWRFQTRTERWLGAPASTPGRSRRSSPPRADGGCHQRCRPSLPRPQRRSCSMAGGLRRTGPATHRACEHAGVRQAVATYPARARS